MMLFSLVPWIDSKITAKIICDGERVYLTYVYTQSVDKQRFLLDVAVGRTRFSQNEFIISAFYFE